MRNETHFDIALNLYEETISQGVSLEYEGIDLWRVAFWPFSIFCVRLQQLREAKTLGNLRQFLAILLGDVRQVYFDRSRIMRNSAESLSALEEEKYILYETAHSAPSALRVLMPIIQAMKDYPPLICEYDGQGKDYSLNGYASLSYIALLKEKDWQEASEFLRVQCGKISQDVRIIAGMIGLPAPMVNIWFMANMKKFILSIRAIKKLLSSGKIVCTVSACETNIHGRMLALLAPGFRIPSVLFQHSSPGVPRMLKLETISKTVGLYGPTQVEIYAEAGVFRERLHAVGAPAYADYLEKIRNRYLCRDEIRNSLGIRDDDKLVVLGLNHFDVNDNLRIIESICQVSAGISKKIIVLMKLHPGDSASFYKGMALQYSRLKIASSEQLSLADAMVIADLLVTLQSNIGIDGIVAGVPVIETNLGMRNPAMPYSPFVPQIRNREQLEEFLIAFFSDESSRETMLSRQADYLGMDFGEDLHGAPQRAVDLILGEIRNNMSDSEEPTQ